MKKENRIESTQEAIERLEKEKAKIIDLFSFLSFRKASALNSDKPISISFMEIPNAEILQGFIDVVDKHLKKLYTKIDELCQEN